MKRIEAYIEKLIKEKNYRTIGCICCEDIPCNECPFNINRDAYGCNSIEELGKWLTEELQEESYTERVITAYDFSKCYGMEGAFDNLSTEKLARYTYFIRTKEDEKQAKEKEGLLRLRGYKVKVQDFIHEKSEVLPWDKE